MNKKEAIIKAYDDRWQLVNRLTPKMKSNDDNFNLHENGFFRIKRLKLSMGSYQDYFSLDQFEHENGYVRPYSLRGLSSNNGWTKIESGKDLPKNQGYYLFVKINGSQERAFFSPGLFEKQTSEYYSHWRNIEEVPNPIY